MKKITLVSIFLVLSFWLFSTTGWALQLYIGKVVAVSSEDSELTIEANTGQQENFKLTADTMYPGASLEEVKVGVEVIIEADDHQAVAINIQRNK